MGEMATQRRGAEGKANGDAMQEEKTSDLTEERKRRRESLDQCRSLGLNCCVRVYFTV